MRNLGNIDFGKLSKNGKGVGSKNGVYSKKLEISDAEKKCLKSGKRVFLKLSQLEHSPTQARSSYDEDEILSLSRSIKAEGMYHPIIVWPNKNKDGFFLIVAGNRRYLATKKIEGVTHIECIVPKDLNQAMLAASSTNEFSLSLHPVDRGREARVLSETVFKDYRGEALINVLCNHYNKSKSVVYEMLSYGRISEDVRSIITKNGIVKRDVLRNISKICKEIEKEDFQDEARRDKEISESVLLFLNSGVIEPRKSKSLKLKNPKIKNFVYYNESEDKYFKRKNVIDKLCPKEKKRFKKFLLEVIREL